MGKYLLVIVLSCLSTSIAWAGEDEPQAGFHRDAALLRDLDAKQLRIVRRATNLCAATDSTIPGLLAHPGRSPCVISAVEHAVRDSNDAELQAYSNALPVSVRYDRYRPGYYWQRMIEHQGGNGR